jgi:hypothetical protein
MLFRLHRNKPDQVAYNDEPTGVTTMTDRPPRRILQGLGTTLMIARMATGLLAQRGHQATGDFMLDRSVTIVVSSEEPGPVRLAAEHQPSPCAAIFLLSALAVQGAP